MQSGPMPVRFVAPSQPLPSPADAASSLAITQYHGRRRSRFTPTLIAIMVVAAAIGAVGAWLAMQ
jgi:hypothetical protein